MEAKDNDGTTALICAAQEGCTAVVELLVEAGADKNATNNYGKTALDWAQRIDNAEMAALLEQ